GNNDNTKSSTYNDILKGDKEIAQREEKIKGAINNYFSKSENQATGGENPRKKWWDENAQHIWEGMIYALTYKDNSETEKKKNDDTNKPILDDIVQKAFFGDKTAGKPGTTGTYTTRYQYDKVVLKDDDDQSGAKSNDDTKLENFVVRPPYFRYLEEWGETFCRQRTRMLEKIKDDCKVENGGKKQNPKCSCYGEHCEHQLGDDPTKVSDLMCKDCAKYCRLYKKWIERKKTEYEKQKKAYVEQQKNCEKESNNDAKQFCETLNTFNDAAEFLEKLGSCKKDSGKGKKFFENEGEAFTPAKDCKPCPEFKINCNGNDHCDNSKPNHCRNKNSIDATDIGNGGISIGNVDMVVSDKDANGFKTVLGECGSANIFKGIREDKWKCGNVCGYEVCIPQKGNSQKVKEKQNDEKHIITIKALLHRWLEYFLEDYNKINKKLKTCTNDKGSKCITECVDTWISKKQQEWKNIKDHYQKQYGGNDSNNSFSVKTVLEELQPKTDVNKAIKPCGDLTKFESFCGLNGTVSSKKENGNEDAIDCMLKKLKEKAKKCQQDHKPSDKPHQTAREPPAPVGDDDDPLEEENTVEAPKICENVLKTQPEAEKEEGDCNPATTEPSARPNPNHNPPAPAPAAPPSRPSPRPQPTNSI
ncbi:hypothetical protein PFTANZ_06346, partial [Plasmodium falciparum Tanzania (2000708)]